MGPSLSSVVGRSGEHERDPHAGHESVPPVPPGPVGLAVVADGRPGLREPDAVVSRRRRRRIGPGRARRPDAPRGGLRQGLEGVGHTRRRVASGGEGTEGSVSRVQGVPPLEGSPARLDPRPAPPWVVSVARRPRPPVNTLTGTGPLGRWEGVGPAPVVHGSSVVTPSRSPTSLRPVPTPVPKERSRREIPKALVAEDAVQRRHL